MDFTALEFALALFAASILGALLPLYRRWSERGLHLFVAIAAGIFLGTIFLHLLPHLAGLEQEHAAAVVAAPHAHPHEHASSLGPWIAALFGLLILFAIEKVWLPQVAGASSANPHTVLWTATYVGLSLHAITSGFAMAALVGSPAASTEFFASLLIHKATETFSLATVMRLAQLSRGRVLAGLVIFAAIEPLGLLLGKSVLLQAPTIDALLTGFACGTFLYVAACDLLPEVFHGHDRPQLKLVAVVAGIGITAISMPRLEVLGGFLARIGAASLDVFLDFAPFLLLGLVLAALIHAWLKRVRLARHFAGNDLKSVTRAALIGAPLPLCSCSVVPVAVALRRAGASKGATTAFAVATPEVGADSIAVSFVMLDPLLAVARPVGAVASAIASGAAVNWLVKSGRDVDPAPAAKPAEVVHGECCPAPAPVAPEEVALTTADAAFVIAAQDHDHAGHDHEHPHSPVPERGFVARILHYAFVEMLDDLAVSLVVGVILSGAIVALLPDSFFDSPIASGFPAMLLMLLIGIPLYVCALTSTPIAAALILKGLSPGAAFVFLLAGPATNIATLLMLSKVLGRRVVAVQVVALSVSVLAMGLLVDRLYPWFGLTPDAQVKVAPEHGLAWWSIASGVVLGGLILASLVRIGWKRDLLSALRDDPALPHPSRSA